MPARLNVALGAGIGQLMYYLIPSRRWDAMAQLKAAFCDSGMELDEVRVVKDLFRNLGRTFMEIAAIPKIDRAYVDRWITIAPGSRERLEAALAYGKGVIFLTAHFGNWELIGLTGALHGYPVLVLARQQGWPRLNQLLNTYRQSKGCRVIGKGFPIRELIRGLKQGKMVGILADQDAGKHGMLSPFFGRLASTAVGPFALALNTGAPILPVFMVRQRGPAHLLTVEEPIAFADTGSLEERIQGGVAAYLAVLERYVRQHPAQWLWVHRRWKSTPQRHVLLLYDGKPGHLSQLKGFAERLESAWHARVGADPRWKGQIPSSHLVSFHTVQVEFKNPVWRAIFNLVASVVPHRFPYGFRWLRWGLTPRCAQALERQYADISVSCGASTASVNLLWSWRMRARTVHIMWTRWPSWRRFDLSVIPHHDRLPDPTGPKLVRTDGALAPRSLAGKEDLERWRKRLILSHKIQIGCLLGGPVRGVGFDRMDFKEAVEEVVAAVEGMDAELLLTTSRRTPIEIEDWLHDRLHAHPRCRLLVLVHRAEAGPLDSTAEAIPCILGLADAVVVSGDSISMVSEAVAQAKPVIGFLPEVKGRPSKQHRFLGQLAAQGKATVVSAKMLKQALVHCLPNRHVSSLRSDRVKADPLEDFLKKWL